jgi:hypothetical protein
MYTLAGFEPGIFSSVGDDLYATPAGHSIFSSFKKATTKTPSGILPISCLTQAPLHSPLPEFWPKYFKFLINFESKITAETVS